jgi:lauroyl/myristoyl acyltransferase
MSDPVLTWDERIQWRMHLLFRKLPIPVASGAGALIGRLAMQWHLWNRRKWLQRFHTNWRILFGEGSARQINECLLSYGECTGRTYAEYAVNDRFYNSPYLRYSGLEHFENLPRPPILLTAHMGNYELAASCLAFNGTPVSTISDLSLATIDRRVAVESRRRCFAHAPGGHMIEAGPSTMRHVVEEMKEGRVIVIYCDELKDGLQWGPALGRQVPMRGNRLLAAKLALKFGAPIVPTCIRRENGCRLHSIVEPPLYLPGRDQFTMEELAARIDAKVETWVREDFDQWYWAPKLVMDRQFPQ